jgi:hypothetical protein
MYVLIRDNEALNAIVPAELSAYLRSNGWLEVRLIGDRSAIWEMRNEAGEEFQTLVPLKHTLDDYILRISQALHTLSVVEERSELDIYADIMGIEKPG